MAFDEVKENSENLKNQLKIYIEKNVDYIQLKSFKILMKSSITIIKYLMIMSLIMFVILFASISLAFVISTYMGSYAIGFLIVSGLYLILIFLFLYFCKNFMEKNLLVKFSKIFFND